jgi:hypothetical protein
MMVTNIDLGEDPTVRRNLKDLTIHQARDPRLLKLIQAVKQQQIPSDLIRNYVLYSKGGKGYSYWRPVLPAGLNDQVIEFVHASLGHLGTGKCMAEVAHTFHVKI